MLDFEAVPIGTEIPTGSVRGGVTFNYDFGGVSMKVSNIFAAPSGVNYLGVARDGTLDQFLDGESFAFGVGASARAFGAYFVSGDPLLAGEIALVSPSGGVGSSVLPEFVLADGGIAYFLGLVSDMPLSQVAVSFLQDGSADFAFIVDDVTLASPIPEPPTVALWGVALSVGICFAYGARIRRKLTRREPLALAMLAFSAVAADSLAASNVVSAAVLANFQNIVTRNDAGFNDFGGNQGTVNSDTRSYSTANVVALGQSGTSLQFSWNFSGGPADASTGLFFSLFGLTDTSTTVDGKTVVKALFPEHHLDLDRIDGALAEPGGPRRFLSLGVELTNRSFRNAVVRVEIKDSDGGGRYAHFVVAPSAVRQTISWDFRDPSLSRVIGGHDLDPTKAKLFSMLIERVNVAENVINPDRGNLYLHRIWFAPDRPEAEPIADDDLLDLAERRTFQYFIDAACRKSACEGVPQDRTTFNDLMTVGGGGFALPALAIGAERGWISRAEAAGRTLAVLNLLGNANLFGPEPVGRIGNNGWFYHFFGVDGRRKLNFDVPETLDIDESLNTVELSTIDTGLALMGALAAQSYFTENNTDENLIRSLAQQVYDRIDWSFMLEPNSQQFFLGWKPNEARNGPPFSILDAAGLGAYSGTPGHPATLDFYTDEAFIVTLAAVGSTTHRVPAAVHCAWKRERGPEGFVRSFPGALFTYQFLHAFVDTRTLNLPACPGEQPVDWFENSRAAILSAIDYATANPRGFKTYGPAAFGISAAEGPTDAYHAYGAPPLAVNPAPEEDGTVTIYGAVSAVSFGDDLRARAIEVLRNAWQRGHWHLRSGLPDAFNDEVAQALPANPAGFIRNGGPWVQRPQFAIDQGPMLLHLENARSGLVWNLMAQNPNIQRAPNRLRAEHIVLEGEDGTGNGQIMLRGAASGQGTVLLKAGESRQLTFDLLASAQYRLSARYSNDNFGPLEIVTVSIDGNAIGHFAAQDTGDFGFGWNVFVSSDPIAVTLTPATHQISISVAGGDGFGMELDQVTLTKVTNPK